MNEYKDDILHMTPTESAMSVKVANKIGEKSDKYQHQLVMHLEEMEMARNIMQKAFKVGSMKLVNNDFQLFLQSFCKAMVAMQKSQEHRALSLQQAFNAERLMVINEKHTDMKLEDKMLHELLMGRTPTQWTRSLGVIAKIAKNPMFKSYVAKQHLDRPIQIPKDKVPKLQKLQMKKKILENQKAIKASQKNGKK